MDFDSNNAVMFGQRQNYPITKMTINCDESSLFLNGIL